MFIVQVQYVGSKEIKERIKDKGDRSGERSEQGMSLVKEDLLQIFESIGRFSWEISVNFAEVMYRYVYVSSFFYWNFSFFL